MSDSKNTPFQESPFRKARNEYHWRRSVERYVQNLLKEKNKKETKDEK